MTDIVVETFVALRRSFFDEAGTSRIFPLREKRNTQDDPLDEYICELLKNLGGGLTCERAPGPLITPDLVVMNRELCVGAAPSILGSDLTRIVGFEVKKLERTDRGDIARMSGMDYNTTPPCGIVRVYTRAGESLDIRGLYIFVSQEPVEAAPGSYRISALSVCDGNLLNRDFAYYLSIVGERLKEINVGSYGDGANRLRPMLIFANPLAFRELRERPTLVHPSENIAAEAPQLTRIGTIRRRDKSGVEHRFHCYAIATDCRQGFERFDVTEPFPAPARTTATQGRGRFRLTI